MAGVPPCMLYLLGCPKSGRVQEQQMWHQKLKQQNEGAFRRVFYILGGVGTQQLSYALKSQESG